MTREQEAQLEALRKRSVELQRLVSLPGWKYAKDVAGIFLSEYRCRPPRTEEERVQWEMYCSLKWILDKTFSTVELLSILPQETPAPRRTVKVKR